MNRYLTFVRASSMSPSVTTMFATFPTSIDPIRSAILLIGGNKTGDNYKKMIPLADQLYDAHLALLKREGLIR